MKVLVVGDNPQAASHGRALRLAGFDPVIPNSHHQDTKANKDTPSVVVLVCDRTRCNGDCPYRRFRSACHTLPVLVIAARRANDAPNRCLENGADDLLLQPYRDWELPARLRAMIRRASEILTVGDPAQSATSLTLDTVTRMAYRSGKVASLTPRESRLLEYLMRHPGQICTREELLERAWRYRGQHDTKVLEVNINRLREKVDTGFETRMIETEQGGYRLNS